MPSKILLIVGHPDPGPKRFCRALADSYAEGAESAGHKIRRIDIAALDFPLLRSQDEFQEGSVPTGLQDAAEALTWSEHVVFVFPLWLGTMPALLKGFLEQLMRPGVAFAYPEAGSGGWPKTILKGRSARLVVTMGMPGFVYRLWFLGHGIAGLRRNILGFVGIRPVRQTFYGLVEGVSDARRKAWLDEMRRLGAGAH
jgi:putative NADPH-quinone reductase